MRSAVRRRAMELRFSERWLSGRKRSPAKGVRANTPSRVRIPLSPPLIFLDPLRGSRNISSQIEFEPSNVNNRVRQIGAAGLDAPSAPRRGEERRDESTERDVVTRQTHQVRPEGARSGATSQSLSLRHKYLGPYRITAGAAFAASVVVSCTGPNNRKCRSLF